jgi:hypothetical protein
MLRADGGMRPAPHAAFRWLGIARRQTISPVSTCWAVATENGWAVADNRTRAMALLREAAPQSRLGAIQLRHDADA